MVNKAYIKSILAEEEIDLSLEELDVAISFYACLEKLMVAETSSRDVTLTNQEAMGALWALRRMAENYDDS